MSNIGAKIINFEVKHFPGARVIGKSVQVKVETTIEDSSITDLLDNMSNSGDYLYLFNLDGVLIPQHDTIGWQGD